MYYLEDSDQEILESPVGQEWKEEARRYWEKYLPKMSREANFKSPAQSYFHLRHRPPYSRYGFCLQL
jgi:hypothetical protein